ncbi:collagen binding domain-containing protein [Paenibacillus aceti]|nr:collagen binding domain-containing protein [Paenibacillus aceti]
MKKYRKPLFMFLVLVLMLNIMLPSSVTLAEGESEDAAVTAQESVTENVYGSEGPQSGIGITDKFSLITVEMYDDKPIYDENSGALHPNGKRLDSPDYLANADRPVAIIFDWELEDGHPYSAGSAYTFTLPDKFAIPDVLSGSLTGGVGDYVVTPAGTVTFTFNDSIDHGLGYEGQFFVWIEFNKQKFGDGLEQLFEFASAGSIVVNFKNTATDQLIKNVNNPKGFNSDEVEWTVDFNQQEQAIQGAELNDQLGDGLSLKDDIKVYELIVNIDGTVKEGSLFRTEQEFPIKLGDIHKAYRVKYKTHVAAPTEEPFLNREYKNAVTLTGNDGKYSKETSASVYISFNEPLNKKVTNSDTVSTAAGIKRTIDWAIEYNYNLQKIGQPIIKDIFNPNNKVKLKLADNKFNVYKVTIDSYGHALRDALIDKSEYDLQVLQDNAGFETGFTLEFKNTITEAYLIEYQTEIEERVYEDQNVTNSVTFGNIEKSASHWIGELIFRKNVKHEDFNEKEIEWELVLNEDRIEMSNIVIKDDYAGNHMNLLPESIKVNDQELTKSPFKLMPQDDYSEGFTLQLKSGEVIKDPVTITYKTSFDPKAGKPADGAYENRATLTWKDLNGSHQLDKQAKVTPQDFTNNNGRKIGTYSAKDKEITWTVIANYNLFNVENATITDSLTGNQTYIKDSFEVNKLILDSKNNTVSIGEVVTNYNLKIADDDKSFELSLGKIGKEAYQVKYRTSLDGNFPIEGIYSNYAALLDGTTSLFEQKAEVTPKHGGELLYKQGRQEGKTDKAAWKVTINPSQSYIPAGSVLTDTLSDNQILLADSLRLYKTDLPAGNNGEISTIGEPLNKDGNQDNDFFKLEVQDNTFTLTFKKELKTAYILQYESYINADSGERIENEAKFAGRIASVEGNDGAKGIQVSLAGAGGGVSTGNGQLKIHKLDDLNQPIEGVIFELWNASNTALLETLITDSNGNAKTVKKYRYNGKTEGLPYKLKEVSTPSGYLADPDYATDQGKDIYFKDPEVPFTIVNEIIRQGFELIKTDSSDPNKKLKGAKFVLNKITSTFPLGIPIDVLETDTEGRIAKGGLESGKYQLVEITAPEFYELDTRPVTFEIKENQTTFVPLSKTNAWGLDGKLIVTKVNAKDQSAIPGVEFELRDSSNAIVAEGVTDQNGLIKFNNLKYGNYTLVEIKADGYVIEQAETAISINQPETSRTIENKVNDRSVHLSKYNSSKDQRLAGAVFELWEQSPIFDQDGNYLYQLVKDIDTAKLTTDKNGELFLDNLKPNKYHLIEVKAPAGFLLDKTPVQFEISDQQTETIFVEKINTSLPNSGGGDNWNSSGNGGGGGGTTTPVSPTPPHPVNSDKESEPGENPDSRQPGQTDPENRQTVNPEPTTEELTESQEETPITPAAETSDKGRAEGAKNQASKGKVLPKTGESSLLPYQLTGLALIAVGATLYLLRRRQLQTK